MLEHTLVKLPITRLGVQLRANVKNSGHGNVDKVHNRLGLGAQVLYPDHEG